MEGSEPGVVVPSVLEAETWVKLCNLPAEFLTADDITLIVSSFGSVVGTDEDTYEKMENHHRPPKLRRKLHSHITFVTIFVRVSVTKPLPSRVAFGSKNGREFIIGLDFDPTPKVCLLCHGAGHFDFECCGTGKDSEEIIAEAGVGFEEVNDVAVEDVRAATSKVSLGDPPVLEVDPPLLPPTPCVSGAADLLDGFDEVPTVERMATVSCLVDEQVVGFNVLFPFEPGPVFLLQFIMDKVLNDYLIAAGNLFGLLFCSLKNSLFELSSFEDFYVVKSSRQHHKWREKAVEQRFLEGDSGSGEGFLGVDMQDADCIGDIFAYIDGVQGAVIIDRAMWFDNPTVVEAALVEDLHNIEQVFFVVKSSNKHHKWRDKSDVQGLVCCSNVLGLSGFDEHSSVEIKETSAVLPFSDFGAANFGTSPAAFLQGRADSCFDQDIFEEWEVLQSLGRFMDATNSTHDQLIFKFQHKWREKSLDWSADRI